LQSTLEKIGLDDVDLHHVVGNILTELGKKDADYDLANFGWCQDFPDPYDYLNKLLSGDMIQDTDNVNVSYFDNPTVNSRLARAARLQPPARYRVYGNLDVQIMGRWAPTAPYEIINDREFFSARIDTHLDQVAPVYLVDLGRIALKR